MHPNPDPPSHLPAPRSICCEPGSGQIVARSTSSEVMSRHVMTWKGTVTGPCGHTSDRINLLRAGR